jgi:phage terminase small subunit
MPPLLISYTPEERQHDGPALRALTDQQYKFVEEFAEQPSGPDAARNAAKRAGYNSSYAAQLMRHPRILAAIRELAGTRIQANALSGMLVAEEIAQDPTHKDRLKAAKWLAELAGFTVVSQQEISVKHENTDTAAMRAELTRLLATVPQANKLLTNAGLEVIDAEFTPVEKDYSLAPDGTPW